MENNLDSNIKRRLNICQIFGNNKDLRKSMNDYEEKGLNIFVNGNWVGKYNNELCHINMGLMKSTYDNLRLGVCTIQKIKK